jgi:hypothetical protein
MNANHTREQIDKLVDVLALLAETARIAVPA